MTNKIDHIKNGLRNSHYAMGHRKQILEQLADLGAKRTQAEMIFSLLLDAAFVYQYPSGFSEAAKPFIKAMGELPTPWRSSDQTKLE